MSEGAIHRSGIDGPSAHLGAPSGDNNIERLLTALFELVGGMKPIPEAIDTGDHRWLPRDPGPSRPPPGDLDPGFGEQLGDGTHRPPEQPRMVDQHTLENKAGFGADVLTTARFGLESIPDGVDLLRTVGHLADGLNHQASTLPAEGHHITRREPAKPPGRPHQAAVFRQVRVVTEVEFQSCGSARDIERSGVEIDGR